MDDELLTVDEVAALLKMNPQTVRNMIIRDELRALHVGPRSVRVRRSELERFIAAGETSSDGEPSGRDALAAASAKVSRAAKGSDRLELADALRSLAVAAEQLAAALEPTE